MAVVFSRSLQAAINHVNGDVVGDLNDPTEEALAEVCIDTYLLRNWGHPAEAVEISKLIDDHGYDAVIAEAVKHVCFA